MDEKIIDRNPVEAEDDKEDSTKEKEKMTLLDLKRVIRQMIQQEMKGESIKEAIHIDTMSYEASHNKKPRGRGLWFFKIGKEQTQFSGSYKDAAAQAKKYAKQKGHYTIKVLP